VFKLSRKNLINFALIACVLLFISNSLSCFKNSAHKTVKPGLSLVGLAKREAGGIFFYHRNMVKAEESDEQIEMLRSKLFDMRELYQENSRLRSLLAFKQQSALRLIPARVIGRFPDNWTSGVILDKGKSNGINTGMVVVNHIGLIGKIIETTSLTSKVLLINDSSQGISSIVQSSRQEGLVSGSLGVNLVMRYLPKDAQISVGDIIVTSELSRIYPKGLLIGKVIKVGYEFSGLNRFAIVKPAVDLANIEEVLVIAQ
jgi:rod shape-determining protein MreC